KLIETSRNSIAAVELSAIELFVIAHLGTLAIELLHLDGLETLACLTDGHVNDRSRDSIGAANVEFAAGHEAVFFVSAKRDKCQTLYTFANASADRDRLFV